MMQIPKELGRLVTTLSLGMDYRELWFNAENGRISFVSIHWNERSKTWETVSTTHIDRENSSPEP